MRVKVLKRQPKSFAGTARYLAGLSRGMSPERVAWMEARNLETTDPDLAAEIMEATAARSTRCKTPAYHAIVAFDPKDAEAGKVTPEIMKKVAAVTIERLGLSEHQILIYAHNDEPHPHMHFLVNRVHPGTGRAWSRSHDYERFLTIARDQARVYGLNVARERTREMEREPDWMKSEEKAIAKTLGPIPEGEAWKAKREERAPEHRFGRVQIEGMRPALQKELARATGWEALAKGLLEQGLSLRAKGQGLILTDGTSYLKLSQVGKAVRLQELEQRFGQSFAEFSETKAREVERQHRAKVYRPPEMPDTTDMTPAQIRHAVTIHAAQLEVYQKRRAREWVTDDPVFDLDKLDIEYRVWADTEAAHKRANKRVRDLERDERRLVGRDERDQRWRKRHDDRFLTAMSLVFKDANSALARWDRIEQARGRDEALRLMVRDPAAFGDLKGWNLPGLKSPERRLAEAAWRRLGELRLKRKLAIAGLEANWNQLRETRALLESARARYAALTFNPEAVEPLPVILRGIIRKRIRALERVTADMIRRSNLVDDRKEELHRALRQHAERKRNLSRTRELEREGILYRQIFEKPKPAPDFEKKLERKMREKSRSRTPERDVDDD